MARRSAAWELGHSLEQLAKLSVDRKRSVVLGRKLWRGTVVGGRRSELWPMQLGA